MARPKKEEAQDTRELAINAADALLHQYGYQGFSMDDIAKAIGVRKASLYHHFPEGKEQLVLAVADRMMTSDENGIQAACESTSDARGRLLAVATYAFSHRTDGARVLLDALRFMTQEHQHQVYARYRSQQFDRVHRVFVEGVRKKAFRSHNTALSASAFMGLLSEMAGFEGLSPQKLAAEVVKIVVDGLNRP
jgi:AcrR family transcriptional regulator